jgi:hypothetical protein
VQPVRQMNARRLVAAGMTALGVGCVIFAFLWPGDPEPKALDLVEAFRSDPVGTIETVAAMEDPVRQRAHIVALSEAYLGRMGPLCKHLVNQTVLEYCVRLAERAHLRTALPAPAVGSPSIWVHGQLPATLSSTWDGLQPDPSGCDQTRATFHICLAEVALERALAGKTREAGATCRASKSEILRQDCFMATAGKLLQRNEDYVAAMSLCLGAPNYAELCSDDLMRRMIPTWPLSSAKMGAHLTGTAEVLRSFWASSAPSLAEVLEGLFWAESITAATMKADSVTGDLLEFVPPLAVPHVRAATALRLLQLEESTQRNLAEWVERLEAVLSERSLAPGPQVVPWPLYDRAGSVGRSIPWMDAPVPSVSYLGLSRRAVADELAADLAICILEAAAMHPTGPPGLLEEGTQHPHSLVRWTAERLIDGQRGESILER